jgi:hypothetical protein
MARTRPTHFIVKRPENPTRTSRERRKVVGCLAKISQLVCGDRARNRGIVATRTQHESRSGVGGPDQLLVERDGFLPETR